MNMVKFGADEILKNKEGTITDEDIDALLDRGKQRTEQENTRLSTEMKHNLANFAINLENKEKLGNNSEFNLFNFEGEDFKSKRKAGLSSSNSNSNMADGTESGLFISMPQREKRSIYDLNEYYNKIMGVSVCHAEILIIVLLLLACCMLIVYYH